MASPTICQAVDAVLSGDWHWSFPIALPKDHKFWELDEDERYEVISRVADIVQTRMENL